MILGIECTAHTFGVAVVDKGRVLSNIRDMFVPESGGIIPNKAANHHKEVSERVYKEALDKAGIAEREIKVIAVSNAPGLAPCLWAGVEFAKKKAKKLNVKLIPVNHCIAHLEIGQSIGAKDPVLLYCSGANTQIIAYASGRYRIFGETLDLGVGNFIDKIARHFGFGFPGGPKIEEFAKLATEKDFIEIPYSIKGMDVSFSGMQTKLQQIYNKSEDKEKARVGLSFSLQETAFAMLVEAAERALAHTGKKELVLGGGVACNSRLQEMCRVMCEERGCKFFCPERGLLTDNAGMIAFTGELMLNADKKAAINPEKIVVNDRERTDQVNVSWR
jgi:glycoprotease/Kae1 family metallohydrolase